VEADPGWCMGLLTLPAMQGAASRDSYSRSRRTPREDRVRSAILAVSEMPLAAQSSKRVRDAPSWRGVDGSAQDAGSPPAVHDSRAVATRCLDARMRMSSIAGSRMRFIVVRLAARVIGVRAPPKSSKCRFLI